VAGNGSQLFRNAAESLMNCVTVNEGGERKTEKVVQVVEMDLNGNGSESVVDEAVDRAWHFLGQIDALVNCYAYEGTIYIYIQSTEHNTIQLLAYHRLQK